MNTKVTRKFFKIVRKFKKHSPEIMAVGGAVGVVVTAVFAAKQTTKITPILEEHNDNLDAIKSERVAYTPTEYRKTVARRYLKTGGKLVKLYSVPLLTGTFSVACILGSCKIMKSRNAILTGGLAALDKNFSNYRERVADKLGQAVEEDLYNGIEREGIKEEITDENGKKKKITKIVPVVKDKPGEHTIVLDTDNAFLFGDNKPFQVVNMVKQVLRMCDNDLAVKGKMTENDIRDNLCTERSAIGGVFGFTYDPENPHQIENSLYNDSQSLQEFLDSESVGGYATHPLYLTLKPNCTNVLDLYD